MTIKRTPAAISSVPMSTGLPVVTGVAERFSARARSPADGPVELNPEPIIQIPNAMMNMEANTKPFFIICLSLARFLATA